MPEFRARSTHAPWPAQLRRLPQALRLQLTVTSAERRGHIDVRNSTSLDVAVVGSNYLLCIKVP